MQEPFALPHIQSVQNNLKSTATTLPIVCFWDPAQPGVSPEQLAR